MILFFSFHMHRVHLSNCLKTLFHPRIFVGKMIFRSAMKLYVAWLSQIASINPFYFYMKGQLSRFMMRSHLRKANIRTLYYVFINVCKNINGDWQFFLVFYYYHLQHNLERQVEYYRYCTWSWDNHRNNCLLNYILTAVNDLCSLCIGT